jgi:hypothetical protein
MRLAGLCAAILLVGVLSDRAVSQTSEQPRNASTDVEELARRIPDCKEFRNACQVCARLADGKLGCSNIGIACTPSGAWQCSAPSQALAPVK